METLEDFAARVGGFRGKQFVEIIKLFAWYNHEVLGKDRFDSLVIRECFDLLSLARPANISSLIAGLQATKPAQILKDRRGFFLERSTRESISAKYKDRAISIEVSRLIMELPKLVPALEERAFLEESIKCYKIGAYRSAVVMVWNLVFHHLMEFVFNSKLSEFNAQWPVTFPNQHKKARVSAISKIDDFAELKESEMIQVCKSAAIITNDVYKILDEKLGKRNSAAHPSSVVFTQIQTESYIDDMVRNVLLKLR